MVVISCAVPVVPGTANNHKLKYLEFFSMTVWKLSWEEKLTKTILSNSRNVILVQYIPSTKSILLLKARKRLHKNLICVTSSEKFFKDVLNLSFKPQSSGWFCLTAILTKAHNTGCIAQVSSGAKSHLNECTSQYRHVYRADFNQSVKDTLPLLVMLTLASKVEL